MNWTWEDQWGLGPTVMGAGDREGKGMPETFQCE